MKEANVTAVYEKDGRWIMAYILEIPGVNTQGKTMREARANLRDALKLILETNPAGVRKAIKGFKKEAMSLEAVA